MVTNKDKNKMINEKEAYGSSVGLLLPSGGWTRSLAVPISSTLGGPNGDSSCGVFLSKSPCMSEITTSSLLQLNHQHHTTQSLLLAKTYIEMHTTIGQYNFIEMNASFWYFFIYKVQQSNKLTSYR